MKKGDKENEILTAENKGRKEGIKEGKKEGRKEEKITIAKKMLEKGFSAENIFEMTGLTKIEIDNIKS